MTVRFVEPRTPRSLSNWVLWGAVAVLFGLAITGFVEQGRDMAAVSEWPESVLIGGAFGLGGILTWASHTFGWFRTRPAQPRRPPVDPITPVDLEAAKETVAFRTTMITLVERQERMMEKIASELTVMSVNSERQSRVLDGLEHRLSNHEQSSERAIPDIIGRLDAIAKTMGVGQ